MFDLPNARGYGDVPDLWVAMTQDAALLSSVQEAILLKWTGGEDVAANSRGNYVNAQHVTAVEALMGSHVR